MQEDLVCRREVESNNPQFVSEYDARTFVFCSRECNRQFDDHPDHYIQTNAREDLPS